MGIIGLIYDMKVNHVESPMGYFMDKVVFSWKVSGVKGKKQEAARIVVSGDEEQKDVILDTGFCKDADSLGWKLVFELRPRTRYFWSVTVLTDKNEKVQSETAWFETGKREETWKAVWIGCSGQAFL